MALQIRRGIQADLPANPADGELLYATDTNKLYVGDGGVPQEISGGTGDIVNDLTPQLGGDLDINGHKIVSSSNGNIEIDPNGTGHILLHGNLQIDEAGNFTKTGQLNFSPTGITSIGSNTALIDGNLFITRNSHSTAAGQGFTFAQHHATADAINFTFYRTRGTGNSPTAVQLGDDLADISFIGWDGTGRASGAAISATVDGTPVLGHIPTKLSFATDNGSTIAFRAELSSAGVWKVDNIQNFSGTDLTLTATNINVAGDMKINPQGNLRFADSDGSNYVGFQAPGSVTNNITWTLPAIDGSNGQVLTTNGTGALSWSNGLGLSTRAGLAPVTTSLLTPGGYVALTITGYKGYIVYSIQTSDAAWVRLYSSVAARNADSTRLEGTDPLPGSGVIAEVITTGAETILITPGVIGFSSEVIPSVDIPCAITNKSGAPAAITVTVTALQLEI